MSTDLYALLGVRKHVSAKALTRAYRKKALATHPDRGGDVEAFKQVERAYRILSHPDRRARYDATGEVGGEQPDNRSAQVLGFLSQLFLTVVNELAKQGKHPDSEDLAVHLGSALQQLADQRTKNRTHLAKLRTVLDGCLSRFRPVAGEALGQDPEHNPLDAMVQSHLAEVDRHLEKLKQEELLAQEARALLADYGWRHTQATLGSILLGPATANSTTSWGAFYTG